MSAAWNNQSWWNQYQRLLRSQWGHKNSSKCLCLNTCVSICGFPSMGDPQKLENPMKKDDRGVPPFQETLICLNIYWRIGEVGLSSQLLQVVALIFNISWLLTFHCLLTCLLMGLFISLSFEMNQNRHGLSRFNGVESQKPDVSALPIQKTNSITRFLSRVFWGLCFSASSRSLYFWCCFSSFTMAISLYSVVLICSFFSRFIRKVSS